MIKIGFEKEDAAKKEYVKLIAADVVKRLGILKTSLTHLYIKPDVNDPDFVSYKAVTRKAINFLQPKGHTMGEKKFEDKVYEKTVNDYKTANAAGLKTINFSGLIALTDLLLHNQGEAIKKILVYPAADLERLNIALMTRYKLTDKINVDILGLAFDWDLHKEITKKIKDFFKKAEILTFCPYCNINEADYSENRKKDKVGSHFFLDHFYDKAKNPLLTFAMYNLVPCDAICNGSNNKGTTPFSNEFHLSPYISGIDRQRMIFETVSLAVSSPPTSIRLRIIPKQTDPMYSQLIGNHADIDEKRNVGNINVFSLQTKYNRKHVIRKVGNIKRKIEDHLSTRDSLQKFLTRMKLNFDENLYEEWYFEEFETAFKAENFHETAYAKLTRDIHDNALAADADVTKNPDIKAIVAKNPA